MAKQRQSMDVSTWEIPNTIPQFNEESLQAL